MAGCTANHGVMFIDWVVVLLLKALWWEGDVWLRHLALVHGTPFPWHCRQRRKRITGFRKLAAKSVVHGVGAVWYRLRRREVSWEGPVRFRSMSGVWRCMMQRRDRGTGWCRGVGGPHSHVWLLIIGTDIVQALFSIAEFKGLLLTAGRPKF